MFFPLSPLTPPTSSSTLSPSPIYAPRRTYDDDDDEGEYRRRIGNAAIACVCGILSILALVDATLAGSRGTVAIYSFDGVRPGGFETTVLTESFQLGYLTAVFLLLPALNHAFVFWWSDVYELQLGRGNNPFRWLEYTFSSSTMSVLIALLCGVVEIKLLVAIICLTMMTMFFGALGESQARNKKFIFIVGCFPFVAKWCICLAGFFFNVARSDGVPPFVVAIVCILVVLESLFGVNQIRRVDDFMSREHAFMLLSPVAKLTLAGLTYGGLRTL